MFDGQAVAQGMQNAAHGGVGQVAIVLSEFKHQIVEPDIGCLDGVVKSWQASLCHGWIPPPLEMQGRYQSLKIVFQNENFIVIDKPHGVLTVPARAGDADPRQCAGRMLERETGGRIFPVHRLDYEVGGIVMFARNSKAHRAASGWFEGHALQKTYEAITKPNENCQELHPQTPLDQPLIWEAVLVRGKKRAFEASHGKKSLTRAWFVRELELDMGGAPAAKKHQLWRLEPVTGRSHQLRWEMFRHGIPILGDTLYGGAPLGALDCDAIALRAVQLSFSEKVDASMFGLPPDGFACESVLHWLSKLNL